MERFAKRHLGLLNEVLGLEIGKPSSDSTFRYLFLQLDVEAFEALLLQWMSQQPALADGVDTLVCDGKTLRGSIDQKPGAAASFIAQVSLYSQPLGVGIAQTTYATDESSETASLLWLLSGIEFTDVLVQADEVGGSRSSRVRQAGPSSPAPAAGGAAAPPGWDPRGAGATSKSGCWLLPLTASAEPLALSRER